MVCDMPDAKALTRTVTTIYLDDDLRDGLKAVKARDGVPEAEQIRRALRGWLQERKAIGKSVPTGVKRTRPRKK
jgi:hypothetical protein